jgi:hypothetical protein
MTPPPRLAVANGTQLDVTLVVNGQPIAVYPAGGGGEDIGFGELPPFPWHVEARSPTGRVLTTIDVEAGDVQHKSEAGVESFTTVMGRVDLSCGRLTIWAGHVSPSGPPPAQDAGEPGDCEP